MDHRNGRPHVAEDSDIDRLAERVTERLVDAVTDPKTVQRVTDAWSGSVDRMIGRGIRRLAGTVVLGVILIAAVKFEVLGKFLGIRG